MIVHHTALAVGLTPEEAARLAAHEAALDAGLHIWQLAGAALLAIREGQLHREQFSSFDAYCFERWGLPMDEAQRLIDRSQVYADVRRETQVTLRSAAQAEALLAVPRDQRAAVVRAALATKRLSVRNLKLAASQSLPPPVTAPAYSSRANGQTRIVAPPQQWRAAIICQDVRDVTLAMLPGLPALVVADPPYNISRDRNFQREGARTITSNFGAWDRLTSDDFDALLHDTIVWSYVHSAPDASIYWFCSDKVLSDVHRYMLAAGWRDGVTIYWHKTNPAPHFMRNTYVSSVEVCVFARKGKPPFHWQGQNAMHNCVEGQEDAPENFIETPLVGGQERVRGEHGESLNLAQKSSQLIRRFVEVSSQPGDLVLDLFAGTGTTSAVAQQLGRRWVAIEKRPEQCSIIEARLARVEQKAERRAVPRVG